MKNNFLILLVCFVSWSLKAQTPQAFSFQGAAFDPSGNPVENSAIAVRIAIVINGSEVYVEAHHPTTDQKGLYALAIGRGNVESGNFASIDWSLGNAFLSLGIDLQNGNNFVPIGVTQLLSVPYALYAANAKIKPRIIVRQSPIYKPITLFKNKESSTSAFNYIYNWVHGEPEDVFVEYKGLPSNIALRKLTLNGYGLNTPMIVAGNVDTIYDGFVGGPVFFQVNDISVDVPTGSYPVTVVFRTKDIIFDSLYMELQVYNSYIQTCIKHDLKTYELESNSCPEIDSLISRAVTLTYKDEESRYVTNVLDSTKLDNFKVLDASCNINFYHNSTLSGYSTNLFFISFEDKHCYINFNLKPINVSTQKTCKLVYKTE
jgi:hypothetical protein